MKRFIIAITRRCGSGATTIAKILAENLGVQTYDRELLRLASDDSGINEQYFDKADEEKKKSLLYRVSRKVYSGEFIPPESETFLSNEALFKYQAKILNELANRESIIVIGRAADFVLRDRPNMISVLFYAPEEDCISHEMELFGLSYDAAVKHIRKQNKYRSEYYAYHTGRKWEDMTNYDLCINTSVLGYEGTAKLIESYLGIKADSSHKKSY